MVTALDERLRARIEAEGPLGFDQVMAMALYDEQRGFYATGGGAGRGRDFLTSPEVGPLFGAVMARALDDWWDELGRPDPFTLIEVGAGTGALARSMRAAGPACLGVLDHLLVEGSSALRARHPDGVRSAAQPPAGPVTGVVLANELLDNLAFRIGVRQAEGWAEVAVDRAGAELAEVVRALEPGVAARLSRLAPDARVGARVPVQDAAAAWPAAALELVELGRVVAIDYGDDTASLAERGPGEWLRTYRGHDRGGPALDALGTQDITAEVALDQVSDAVPPTRRRRQAAFLAAHGLEVLVEEGRRIWTERAHLGDLEAMTARSRISEAEALTDPTGLGAFHVLEWAP